MSKIMYYIYYAIITVITQIFIQMSKAEVNIQTAISFLQQITGRANNTIPDPSLAKAQDLQSPFKHPRHFVPTNPSPKVLPSNPALQKKEEQNVEFKRFYQTADIIEDTLVKFYQNDEDIYRNIEKSSETRLNIYYRQNARILKQIRVQNEIVRSNNEGNIEEKEAKLNWEFKFTVKDDCRDNIQICITKAQQKLSKMIEDEATFKQVLVVMVDNQLKVYRDCTENKLLKVIRMYEIEHISYNQQPVKCIVISFLKDKSKPAEHLYMKFDNNQDHDKWDRIIFINLKLYKMSKKTNLFEFDFDRNEKTEHFKKAGKEEIRQVNVPETIQVLCQQEINKNQKYKGENRQDERERDRETESERERERDREREWEREKERERERERERQREIQQEMDRDRQRQGDPMTFSVHGGKQSLDERRREESPQILKDRETSILNADMTRSLLNPRAKQASSPQVPLERVNTNEFNSSFGNPQIRIDLVDGGGGSFMNERIEPSIKAIERSEMIVDDPSEREDGAESKIKRIEMGLSNGLYVTKINFLKNSKKIIFLDKESFKYIDQDEYRTYMTNKKNKDPYKEPHKKEIRILDIDRIDDQKEAKGKEEKGSQKEKEKEKQVGKDKDKEKQKQREREKEKDKQKEKQRDKLTLTLNNGKKFQIKGFDLSEFNNWLKLKLSVLIRDN